MKKNKVLRCVICGLILLLCFNSCKPVMGSAWYSRSGDSTNPSMYITDIKIKGITAEPCKTDSGKGREIIDNDGFSNADYYIINVPPNVQEISALDIKIEVVNSLKTMEKIKPEELDITVNGDEVYLISGQAQPLTISIKHNQKKYTDINTIIKITQDETPNLVLTKLSVFGTAIDDPASETVSISVPYRETVITAANIKAEFKIGNDILTERSIEILGGVIRLEEEVPTDIVFIVNEEKGQYKKFEKTITVTREKRKAGEAAALEAEEIEICGSVGTAGEVIVVPAEITKITKDDVTVTFKGFDINVTMSPEEIEFGASDTVKFTLSVPEKENVYLAWKLDVTVKKDASGAIINNPTDKYNRPKYIQKIITEEIIQDPFDYYNEQSGGFSASIFDTWILNMTSISSDDVASYIFKNGEWSGDDPAICEGPQISPGAMNTAWDLKYYKFKSRASRWADEDGFKPNLSAEEAKKEERFLFCKFTGKASMGTKLNNSMFCIDTYSKFLFFYSEPGNKKTVAGHTMPSDWRDYNAPSFGNSHTQSNIPFYLSDPVGYVLQDGSVIIYNWVKTNIANGNYNLRQTTEKPAEKKLSAPGYSPYRDQIKTKKTRIENIKNPAYTVSEPIIKTQPRSIRAKLNTEKDISFKIRTARAPEGEKITYQWYIANDFDGEGTPIADAVDNIYKPDKTKKINAYCYCIVKNTNEENHETTEVKSEVVQLYIDETLIVNAEKPRITGQPKNILLSLNEEKEIQLAVAAISMDKGTLSYQWYEVGSNGEELTEIDGAVNAVYEFTPDTSSVGEKRYCCVVKNTNTKADGEQEAEIKSAIVTITVQEAYKVDFKEKGKGFLTVLLDKETVITSGTYVQPGHSIMFIASPEAGYKIKSDGWTSDGGTLEYENSLKNITIIQVGTTPLTVTVEFEKIPNSRTLTITAKSVYNKDMKWDDDYPYTYFIYDLRTKIGEDGPLSLWSIYGGNDLNGLDRIKHARKLYIDEAAQSNKFTKKDFDELPDNNYKIELQTKLVKYHDGNTGNQIKKKYLSDYNGSIVIFEYNHATDTWNYKPTTPNLPNLVSVEFPESFTITRDEEKDFTIRYIGSDKNMHAFGTVEVTYTISWK